MTILAAEGARVGGHMRVVVAGMLAGVVLLLSCSGTVERTGNGPEAGLCSQDSQCAAGFICAARRCVDGWTAFGNGRSTGAGATAFGSPASARRREGDGGCDSPPARACSDLQAYATPAPGADAGDLK